RTLHAEDLAVEPDVLAAGQLGMHPRADLVQRRDAPADRDAPGRRIRDPRREPERGALARAVRTDDREAVTLDDLERDVGQRQGSPRVLGRAVACTTHPPRPRAEIVSERRGTGLLASPPPTRASLRHPVEAEGAGHSDHVRELGLEALEDAIADEGE